MSTFKERVRKVVQSIPKGEVRTYGEVAALAGSPGAARAVGNMMKRNDDPQTPCHRVVKADGSPGEYNGIGGKKSKREMLEAEGYVFKS